MMTSLDALWRQLEKSSDFGGCIRTSDEPADNFFCYLDATGRRGLLLVTDGEPPRPAVFHAVDVTIGQRSDGRWSLLIVLKVPALTELFRLLCTDLVAAAHDLDRSEVPQFILARLLRWRRLLEAGDAGLLTLTQIRGLMGELLIMRECFKWWPIAEVIEGWVGPLDAPQDFALPSMRIEVKSIMPTSPRATISSADQLDAPEGTDLRLAVVRLANAPSESNDGLSPPMLVKEIREALERFPSTHRDFDSRLISGWLRGCARLRCF